jgi:hypothetical protein
MQGTAPTADKVDKSFRGVPLVGGYNDDVTVTPDGRRWCSRDVIKAPNEVGVPILPFYRPATTGDVDPGKESCSLAKD